MYFYSDKLLNELDAAGWIVAPRDCPTCGDELGLYCPEHGFAVGFTDPHAPVVRMMPGEPPE